MIKAAVFDFDGTLTELTLDFPEMRESLDRLLATYVGEELMKRYAGLYMLEKIAAAATAMGSKGAELRGKAFSLLRDMEVLAAEGKDVFPFTRQVLGELKGMRVAIGVITRNCGAAIGKVFREIDDYADAVVTREDTLLVKPDPAHPRAVLGRLGIAPSDAILIGDHPTDMAAGRAAGMVSAGVLSGRSTKEELTLAGADYLIDDIRGLIAIVKELNGGPLLHDKG